jgi:glycosyltransferase involved in cell wall biosynthesis
MTDNAESPIFSIVIPAYNEEKYLPKCLAAIEKATEQLGEPVEVIVANNVSTDGTGDLARSHGARVIDVPERCISTVKNRGTEQATGKYLVFIDADDMMSANMLVEVKKCLDSGRYIGGGVVNMRTDRMSLGIVLTFLMMAPFIPLMRVSIYLFYTTPEAFWKVGGFDEELLATEDVDFALKLKKLGKERGLKYKNMWRAQIIKSARKFDEFGDWVVFRHPIRFLKACLNDREAVSDFWYRVSR